MAGMVNRPAPGTVPVIPLPFSGAGGPTGIPAGNFMGATTFNPAGQMLTQVGGPGGGGGGGGILGPYAAILAAIAKKKEAEQALAAKAMLKGAAGDRGGGSVGMPVDPSSPAGHASLPTDEVYVPSGYTGYSAMPNASNGPVKGSGPAPGNVASGGMYVKKGSPEYYKAIGGVETATVGPMTGSGAELSKSTTDLEGAPGSNTSREKAAKEGADFNNAQLTPEMLIQLQALQRLMAGLGTYADGTPIQSWDVAGRGPGNPLNLPVIPTTPVARPDARLWNPN